MRSRIEWLIMANANNMNRRTFLETAGKTSISAALIPTALTLFSEECAYGNTEKDDLEKYDFLMPRVKFEYDGRVKWNVFPGADTNLLAGAKPSDKMQNQTCRWQWHESFVWFG